MHRPLREPIYLRIWRLVRGLLFYNTVYWRKASDGLSLPSMTLEERERQRPERNLEIIRPRMRPRAHLDAGRGGDVSHPPELVLPEGDAPAPPVVSEPSDAVEHFPAHSTRPGEMKEDETGQVYVKRRRYRRRLVARGSAIDRGSFLARVFGKKD